MESLAGYEWLFLGLVIVITLLVTVLLTLRVRRSWDRRKRQITSTRAFRGEDDSVFLLESQGFEILAEQEVRSSRMAVDGEWTTFQVRADLIVQRDGRRYVVEVKTGSTAPDPLKTATRRQLFEYHHLFQLEGVLLADMEQRQIRTIDFPPAEDAEASPRWKREAGMLLLGLLMGAGLTLWATYR